MCRRIGVCTFFVEIVSVPVTHTIPKQFKKTAPHSCKTACPLSYFLPDPIANIRYIKALRALKHVDKARRSSSAWVT